LAEFAGEAGYICDFAMAMDSNNALLAASRSQGAVLWWPALTSMGHSPAARAFTARSESPH